MVRYGVHRNVYMQSVSFVESLLLIKRLYN